MKQANQKMGEVDKKLNQKEKEEKEEYTNKQLVEISNDLNEMKLVILRIEEKE